MIACPHLPTLSTVLTVGMMPVHYMTLFLSSAPLTASSMKLPSPNLFLYLPRRFDSFTVSLEYRDTYTVDRSETKLLVKLILSQ